MTIELVDGHGGKPHISGEDLGDFKAGILGDAGYVFKRANMLAATLNGSNSITIATGSGIMPTSGRHFRVTAPETLTITSGTQGQNRNDLIVVRATTDEESTTVETATLVVLRGTPTSGTATDPTTQDGDLPLYRLQLTGVSVAEPIALFDVMVPYSEFRDSISPVCLFESKEGAASNFNLKESVANFKYLNVYCSGGCIYRLYDANGKTLYLSSIAASADGSFNVAMSGLKFSGNSATFSNSNHFQFYKTGGSATYDRYTIVHQRIRVVLVEGVR